MKPSDGEEALLAPAARVLVDEARRSLGAMSLHQRSRGLARVTARVAQGSGGRLSPWVVAALGCGVVAAVGLAGRGLLHPARGAVLSYLVEGGTCAADGSLHPAGDRRPTLRFSDGTQVELADPAAHVRVAAVTEHGARVALDGGELHAHVVHWSGARWLFEAGPFTVTVTGTAFALSWAPDDERLDLRLENGSLAVAGPVSDQPIALRSGQWLTVHLQRREVVIRDLPSVTMGAVDAAPPPAASAEAPIPSPPQGNDPGAVASARPHALESPGEPLPLKRDWATKLATGELDEIVAEAERWGLGACLAEATSGELAALADAARYTKRGPLATQALLAQRRRFAGSARAAEAAFLLGRLTETQEGPAAALSWFEEYLVEAPRGAYAAEALGRRMSLVEKTAGRERARTIAQEYLRRFPGGTYAGAARALVRTP